MAAKTVTLGPDQTRRVGQAREIAAAKAADLSAGYEYIDSDDQAQVYGYAFGAAQSTIRGLLEVIDQLTGGR